MLCRESFLGHSAKKLCPLNTARKLFSLFDYGGGAFHFQGSIEIDRALPWVPRELQQVLPSECRDHRLQGYKLGAGHQQHHLEQSDTQGSGGQLQALKCAEANGTI